MTLNLGTRLGAYEILSLLGAGGMGEVYRARDSKLGREIAIKVLPEAFTRDPERLARFEREARLLASLNHPNIGSIYGLEESNGTRFLVLELVPGETLADLISPQSRTPPSRGADRPSGRVGEWESGRISRGFEIDEALRVCLQIAEAVEAAHEKGIIHRDLKPANVKVTPEGKVKVLDFGLAKAFAPDESSPSISLSPTLTLQSLREGVILGTAAYMSPEQARGKPLDKRTDIWSFGCVLYECLAGRQAFTGETVTDIIAAIVKNDPEWALLPATTPPNIQLLLRRCLQKDRNIRLHDIADARIEIDEALKAPSPALPLSPSPAPPEASSVRLWMAVSALLAMIVVALALAVVYLSRPGEETGAIRSYVLPPEKSSFFSIGGIGAGPVAVSPDGRRITFVALTEGKRQLWVRPLDALAAQPLAGTEDASYPFWSADSQYIGFFTGGKLKKINASGGPAQTLCDAPIGRGGTWNRDGTILFAPNAAGSLYRVSAAGGAASAVTKVNESRGERAHRFPCFLPDGRHFLYIDTASRGGGES
ncbi:MAG TPA: protein kinase, partial [Acidobacteriota bacterium]|nr:protein kinase [Acidobacteriota bacterium]